MRPHGALRILRMRKHTFNAFKDSNTSKSSIYTVLCVILLLHFLNDFANVLCCVPSSGLHVTLELALTFTSMCSDMLKMHWLHSCFLYLLWKVRTEKLTCHSGTMMRSDQAAFFVCGLCLSLVLVSSGSLAPTGTKSAFWRSACNKKKTTNMRNTTWVTKSKMNQRRQLLPNIPHSMQNWNRDRLDRADVTHVRWISSLWSGSADMIGL